METKGQIRERLKQKRSSLTLCQAMGRSDKICREIREFPWFLQAETICFYHPIGREVDLLPLAKEALALGRDVAFPRVEGKEMEFYQVDSLDGFVEGSFHVMEPAAGTPMAKPGMLVLVPGVGFAQDGSRMGYGGGYYDRYFARHRDCLKIGVAYSFQLVEGLEPEAHDIPMDGVVTEEGVLEFWLQKRNWGVSSRN